ncbi:MAG: SurA N-terminal domain-containing protein [Xanthobacteraceae bacterium]|jgi:peptidyl-prolyl cis-trans isomerase SurA|nr:SurA N-terminal domain-containing protein [Hyphomicrobiales bacterium]
MMTFSLRLTLSALISIAALSATVGATPARAQSVAAMVNGEPITNFDIDQRMRLMALSNQKGSRKQVLEDLIDEKVKIKEAKKYGVNPTAADIDSSYASMSQRMRLSPEQLTKTLAGRGIRPETLRERIRADMVWSSLVRGRFKDSLMVTDKAVRTASGDLSDGKSDSNNFEYQMRPIVLVVPRGSSAATIEMRRKEAETLRSRVQSCDDANTLFRSMRNATIRDTVVKTSADLPQALRELLDKTPVGHLTAPEVTRQGIEMVALCERKPTSGDTPEQRKIREKLYTQKYEARSKSYLQDIRKAAMIEYR